jgi:hypothetical protein
MICNRKITQQSTLPVAILPLNTYKLINRKDIAEELSINETFDTV